MAKRKSTRKGGAKRASTKRDLVRRKTSSAYAKRTRSGKFRDMDDVGRSQRADRKTTAKRKVKSGYGDQGDRKRGKKTSKRSRGR